MIDAGILLMDNLLSNCGSRVRIKTACELIIAAMLSIDRNRLIAAGSLWITQVTLA